MDNIHAGVVTRQRFVTDDSSKSNAEFQNYINYMIRDEAVGKTETEHITLFNEYIYANYDTDKQLHHEKLFTANKDSLSPDETMELKQCFQTAQKNKSCMWQTVISFDNDWLAKNGLYDNDTGAVDVYKLQDVTRKHMNVMLGNEGLLDTTVWSASIHFNTAHTHIHIAAVEPIPTRQRMPRGTYHEQHQGRFKLSSILNAKSKVVNDIVNNSRESTMISDIIRTRIIANKKASLNLAYDKDIAEKFIELHNALPGDKRLWKYNNNAMNGLRPLIDEISKMYIEKYNKEDFELLEKLLDEQSNKYIGAYGKSKKIPKDYKQSKLKDLYGRLGNTILKEVKEYERERKQAFLKEIKDRRTHNALLKYRKYKNAKILSSSMLRLKNMLDSDYEHSKNQFYYEQLEWELEQQGNYKER